VWSERGAGPLLGIMAPVTLSINKDSGVVLTRSNI